MKPKHRITPELSRLLVLQENVVSRTQVLAHGLTRRSIDRLLTEDWVALLRGVYLAGDLVPTAERLAWAAHLSLGESSAVGGPLALSLLGIDVDARDRLAGRILQPQDGTIDMWVPENVERRCPDPIRVLRDHSARLARRSSRLLPTIGAADALIDFGGSATAADFVDVLTRAELAGRCTAKEVIATLVKRPRAEGRRMMWEITHDLEGIESTLELTYRDLVERAHGLPPGTRQARGISSRIDVRYDRFRTLVELDGRRSHTGRAFRDMGRDNRHALREEITLRYGTEDVRGTPCIVAAQVGFVLMDRGWAGLLQPCPSCSSAHVSGDTSWWLG